MLIVTWSFPYKHPAAAAVLLTDGCYSPHLVTLLTFQIQINNTRCKQQIINMSKSICLNYQYVFIDLPATQKFIIEVKYRKYV